MHRAQNFLVPRTVIKPRVPLFLCLSVFPFSVRGLRNESRENEHTGLWHSGMLHARVTDEKRENRTQRGAQKRYYKTTSENTTGKETKQKTEREPSGFTKPTRVATGPSPSFTDNEDS